MTKHLFSIAVLVAVACWGAAARAAVIVNDTWLDGTRSDPSSTSATVGYSENGADGDGDGDIESAWYNAGTGATITTSTNHMVLNVPSGSASWETYFTPENSPVTLANAGDNMKVTWVFTPATVNTTNTSQNFRIALVNSSASARATVDGTPPGSDSFAGYAIFGNMGVTTGNGNSFQLRERTAANSDLLSTSGNWAALGNGLGNNATGYASGTTYTFVMSLTRNASAGLDILTTMSGGNIGGTGLVSVNLTDATPTSFAYDTFALRPSGASSTAASFDTTLFKVEYTSAAVPEVSAGLFAALACTASGVIAVARRRKG